MIRDAKFQDIPAIVGVIESSMRRSHYADGRMGQVDVKEAKRLLLTAIQRHGHKNGGGCWVQVSETDGIITGFILGTLNRLYSVATTLMATDLFWLSTPNVDPKDPAALMRGMIEWARSCPHVVEVKCGTTQTINEDATKAGKILQRLGMAHYGEIYRMEIER